MCRPRSSESELLQKYFNQLTSVIAGVLISAYSVVPATAQEHRTHSANSMPKSPASQHTQASPLTWTKFPALLPAGRGERGAAVLRSPNSNASDLTVVGPDIAKPWAVQPKNDGKWTVKQPDAAAGGYHLLFVKDESATETRTASTLWMFQSKPQSPEKMLANSRPGLEIQPLRLPQFGGFREGQTGEFLIRFDGLPVAGASLTIDTENGSHETTLADGNGVARILFPRDFDPAVIEKEGGAARARRSFVLGAELERNGIRHTTGLTLPYLPDLMRERNLMAGAGLFAFGMLLATPMLRRKKARSDV
jgi:hypothetical protein